MMKILKKILGKKLTAKEGVVGVCFIPNSTLANYLKYYVSLKRPGYAVLITGAWGVGKTHQVKNIIPDTERYFVSLYGIESVEGIHDAVLASCLPSLNLSEYASAIGDVGKAMGDKFAVAGFANSAWTIFLRQRLKPDRTIIFDDLERSSLWRDKKSELLGAINHYVEQQGFRVVVICHDELIKEQIAELKEKTFGHTIKVEPQVEEAIAAFIFDVQDEPAREFIVQYKFLIKDIWVQSENMSLRILKHVINDVARLRISLKERHLENRNAMEHVLRFFCALDIEVRAGVLSREMLCDRMNRYVKESIGRNDKTVDQPLSKIISRYPSADLTGSILSDEILEATLIAGRYDSQVIAECLDGSAYFIEASEIAPWRVVMKFDEIEDGILNEGIARMQKQFDERSVTEVGEFLHIASLRLMLAEQGASGRTMHEEKELCFGCIDDLSANGNIAPKSLNFLAERIYSAYEGYGYWVSDVTQPYFREICAHVEKAQIKSFEATYPILIEGILHKLREDQSSIFKAISRTGSEDCVIADVPILNKIPVDSFLDAWLSGPRSGWRQTKMALDNRYSHGQIDRYLKDEKPWLLDLERQMDVLINAMTGLDAYRLTRIKPKVFDDIREIDSPK